MHVWFNPNFVPLLPIVSLACAQSAASLCAMAAITANPRVGGSRASGDGGAETAGGRDTREKGVERMAGMYMYK